MKKILATFLCIFGFTLSTAYAQFNIGTINGSVDGVPVSFNGQNGGSISIGVGAGSNGGVGGANQVNGNQLLGILNIAQTLVARLIPFTMGLAVLAFFWYLVMFISKGAESAEKRKEGLHGISYSLIAIFVMVSIWGIISLASNILGVGIGGGIPALELPKTK